MQKSSLNIFSYEHAFSYVHGCEHANHEHAFIEEILLPGMRERIAHGAERKHDDQ